MMEKINTNKKNYKDINIFIEDKVINLRQQIKQAESDRDEDKVLALEDQLRQAEKESKFEKINKKIKAQIERVEAVENSDNKDFRFVDKRTIGDPEGMRTTPKGEEAPPAGDAYEKELAKLRELEEEKENLKKGMVVKNRGGNVKKEEIPKEEFVRIKDEEEDAKKVAEGKTVTEKTEDEENNEEETKICPECGEKYDDRFKYCACGTKLKNIGEEEKPEEPEEESEEEDFEYISYEDALNTARAEYVKGYKEFKAEKKKRNNFLVRGAMRVLKIEDEKDKPGLEKLKILEKKYDEATIALGNAMYEAKNTELFKQGLEVTKHDAELALYKQNEIFKKVIIEEQEKLAQEKINIIPPKEKSWYKKGFDWYARRNKVTKIVISVGVTSAIASAFFPSLVAAAGGLGIYASSKIIRSLVVGTSIQTGIKGVEMVYDKIFGRNINKIKQESETKARENFSKVFGGGAIIEGKKIYSEILEREAKAKRTRIITKAVASITIGGVANYGIHHFGGGSINTPENAQTGNQIIQPTEETWYNSPLKTLKNWWNSDNKPTLKVESLEAPTGKDELDSLVKSKEMLEKGTNLTTEELKQLVDKSKQSHTDIKTILENTIVHKGEGIEHPLIRQIESNPELAKKLGFTGDTNDTKALHKFAQGEAHRIALENNKANLRISEADKVSYKITGVDSKGKAILEESADYKKYEYEYKKNTKVTETQTTRPTQQEEVNRPGKNTRVTETEQVIKNKADVATTSDSSDIKPKNETITTDKTVVDKETTKTTETTVDKITKKDVPGIEDTDTTNKTTTPKPTAEEIKTKIETQMDTKALIERNPQLKDSPFFENKEGLTEKQLVETNEVYQKNLEYIKNQKDAPYDYDDAKDLPAKNFIGAEKVPGDLIAPYVNNIYNASGKSDLDRVKPEYDSVKGDEKMQDYIKRVLPKVAKENKLDEVKIKEE